MKYFLGLLASAGLFFATSLQAGNCPVNIASYNIQQGRLLLPAVSVEGNTVVFAAELELLDSQNLF